MTSDFGNPLRKFKLVFLGEQSVGKTSLITRLVSTVRCYQFGIVRRTLAVVADRPWNPDSLQNSDSCTIHSTIHIKPQSELIFFLKQCIWKTELLDFNFGILLVKVSFSIGKSNFSQQ